MSNRPGSEGCQTIIEQSWKELNSKNYDHSIVLADQCFEMVKERAIIEQENLSKNTVSIKILKKDEIYENWALNYAGECLFLIGEAYRLQGKNDQAKEYYLKVINEFPNSFGGTSSKEVWKIKEAAESMINKNKKIAQP